MQTDCTSAELEFEGLGRRRVVGRFDGGRMTSDGGALLLRAADRVFNVTGRLAACLTISSITAILGWSNTVCGPLSPSG